MSKKLKITQIKSIIGCIEPQKRTMRSLGIKKMNGVAIHDDNNVIRGMIDKVKHLVKVEEVDGE
jgi:large subunit ribosomal protein L30